MIFGFKGFTFIESLSLRQDMINRKMYGAYNATARSVMIFLEEILDISTLALAVLLLCVKPINDPL